VIAEIPTGLMIGLLVFASDQKMGEKTKIVSKIKENSLCAVLMFELQRCRQKTSEYVMVGLAGWRRKNENIRENG
jgi:stalled ribosome alternative rescue factor ArfA